MCSSVCQWYWREPGSERCNVLGGVYRAPWPEVGQRADRADAFALLAATPGESKRPEDKPGEGPRPAESGGHYQSPEQHPGPRDHRGEGRGTQLPALQPCSAHVVWPVWRLHLGTVQAEPAVYQWVGLRSLFASLVVYLCDFLCACVWREKTARRGGREFLIKQRKMSVNVAHKTLHCSW